MFALHANKQLRRSGYGAFPPASLNWQVKVTNFAFAGEESGQPLRREEAASTSIFSITSSQVAIGPTT
jgi:hypothetical protein